MNVVASLLPYRDEIPLWVRNPGGRVSFDLGESGSLPAEPVIAVTYGTARGGADGPVVAPGEWASRARTAGKGCWRGVVPDSGAGAIASAGRWPVRGASRGSAFDAVTAAADGIVTTVGRAVATAAADGIVTTVGRAVTTAATDGTATTVGPAAADGIATTVGRAVAIAAAEGIVTTAGSAVATAAADGIATTVGSAVATTAGRAVATAATDGIAARDTGPAPDSGIADTGPSPGGSTATTDGRFPEVAHGTSGVTADRRLSTDGDPLPQ